MAPVNATNELLQALAAHDERCLYAALWPGSPLREGDHALDRRTRMLVQLAALVAADASTSSLRWAVDRAAATGADDRSLVQVLRTVGRAAGSAQTVTTAPRLALALDLDTGVTDQG